MKNITVTVPDDVYRTARIRAAERGTSVSALVGEYLGAAQTLCEEGGMPPALVTWIRAMTADLFGWAA